VKQRLIQHFSAYETKELKTHLTRQRCAKTHVRQSGI